MPYTAIRALTLDLDDTLWPIAPVIRRAERTLRAWLEAHAPATAAGVDRAAMMRLRADVEREHPELLHDLGALRLETLRRAVAASGEPRARADEAFEVFMAERQRVEFYPEALAALRRLAARYPLLSVSNGNADLHRVGVGEFFRGSLSARDAGHAKPDPRIFAEACRRLGVGAPDVLHIGDDVHTDVHGARAAGLAAVWLCRPGAEPFEAAAGAPRPALAEPWRDTPVVTDLDDLAARLNC